MKYPLRSAGDGLRLKVMQSLSLPDNPEDAALIIFPAYE